MPIAPSAPAAAAGSIATMPAQPAATPTAPLLVTGGRFIALPREPRGEMTATASVDRASAALLVERLSKVYGDGTRALDELELRIPSGCFFGLLGPNGAGKTTLIGAISGLVRAPAGHAFVFGHDAVTDLQSRLLVGVAPQEVHLDRFLTARELLAYHGRYFGLPKLEAQQRSDELLEVFDLAEKANTRPNRLSGGMRRRLLIARALVHRPRLLILDEPTAGVDLEL